MRISWSKPARGAASSLLLLALLASNASASSLSAVTHSYCTTYFTTKPQAHVPTRHHTSITTEPATIIVTSRPTITTTPTVTTTVVSTETSVTKVTDRGTDTFTTTSTEGTSTTVSASAVTHTSVTVVTTTTTVTSTSSLTAGSTQGFIPIQSSVPGGTYDGAGGGPQPNHKRSIDGHEGRAIPGFFETTRADHGHQLQQQCRRFPECVDCTESITSYSACTRTVEASSTCTATAPAVTRTVHSTVTTTISSCVAASTTVTSTVIIASTSTVTPTSTTTSTSTTTGTATAVSTVVVSEQCTLPNNYLDRLPDGDGVTVVIPAQSTSSFTAVTGPQNAFECCEECAPSFSCAASYWEPSDATCYIYNADGCDFGSGVQLQAEDGPYGPIFNNGCGVINGP